MSLFAKVVAVCALATNTPEAKTVCIDVAQSAERLGVDPLLAMAIAYKETHFRPRPGDGGKSRGVLQVSPYYHCPNRQAKGCDMLEAGIRYMRALSHATVLTTPKKIHKIKPSERVAYHVACHYKGGHTCGSASKASAYRVVRTMRKMRKAVE